MAFHSNLWPVSPQNKAIPHFQNTIIITCKNVTNSILSNKQPLKIWKKKTQIGLIADF